MLLEKEIVMYGDFLGNSFDSADFFLSSEFNVIDQRDYFINEVSQMLGNLTMPFKEFYCL